ncbi:unnamed protein product [Diabrotica balteata]|uniref:THAP-type domain-containing protein n=1 Tax=Diabrotica balteata TaxID=107213 RepID=A0A9N9SUA9_DIABA|nr:unnamed protein product [Diabrotica balteata]
MMFKCCVPGCKNYQKDAQMHIFPKNQGLYNVWIKRIGHPNLQEIPMEKVRTSCRVCNVHFGPDAQYIGLINKSTIKKDAIPSLFLPLSKTCGIIPFEPEAISEYAFLSEYTDSIPQDTTLLFQNDMTGIAVVGPSSSINNINSGNSRIYEDISALELSKQYDIESIGLSENVTSLILLDKIHPVPCVNKVKTLKSKSQTIANF